jgi:hypothetical protein
LFFGLDDDMIKLGGNGLGGLGLKNDLSSLTGNYIEWVQGFFATFFSAQAHERK